MADDTEAEDQEDAPRLDRDKDLLGRSTSKLRARLTKDFDDIWRAFADSVERNDDIMDYWDCYNCVLNDHQFYDGQAQIYVPLIRDAVEARATRFVNQLFPPGGNYVEGVATDGTIPKAELAIVAHYIRASKLKTQIGKPLSRNGDIEGQYNLYVDWNEIKRQIVSRETYAMDAGELGGKLPGEDIEDIKEEDVTLGMPAVKVIHDTDVMVLPATVDSVDEALQVGGSVTIVRRWTKAKVRQMIDEGAIRAAEGEDLIKAMERGGAGDGGNVPRDAEKALREHVGIKNKGQFAVVWETWKMLPLNDKGDYDEKGTPRLCRIYFAATGDKEKLPLGAKRNPFWNDRCPLLSEPVKKIAGRFKGESEIAPVASLQYEANDAVNEGADAATYAAGPIVARDPEKTQANLIFNIGAVWDVSPNDVKFLEFPDLTARAIARIQYAAQAIFQTLGVNPAMLPQQTGRPGSKRNQAEIALELQVDLLTTAEAVSVMAEGIYTPLVEWFVDLDHQFRDRDLTIREYGEMGMAANMELVPPLRNRKAVEFTWVGAETARYNAQVMQQGTAFINVVRGMRQDLMAEGISLRLAPVIEQAAAGIYGPKMARLLIVDQKSELSIEPDMENQLLADGNDLQVHPLDPDAEHLKKHVPLLQGTGDPTGVIRIHIQRHLKSMQLKTQAAFKQQMAQQLAQRGAPGVPGGAGPGVAGTPRPGAVPMLPRGGQRPAGAIHADRMPGAGAVVMPRKM